MPAPCLLAPICDSHPLDSSAGPQRAACLSLRQQAGRGQLPPQPPAQEGHLFIPPWIIRVLSVALCWAGRAAPFGVEVAALPGCKDRTDGLLAESESLPKGKR